MVIGLLGTKLDAGKRAERRWDAWRPTVALGQQEDFVVDRLELLVPPGHQSLATLVAKDLKSVSPATEVRLHAFAVEDPWELAAMYGALYDFVRAYPFDADREDYFVHITTGTHIAQICLFLLVESHHLPGRLLQTSPPSQNQRQPRGTLSIIDLDLSRYDSLARRFELEHREARSLLKSGIATKNAAFNRLIEEIELVALRTKSPILLQGPTGAGKSRLALRLYELKRARHQLQGPFVEINCATLRGDLAHSTLFGHKRGAFTGAAADRPGLLRAANGGVLFLDEIGELGLDEQAMLLRGLEEKRFLPLGSDTEATSDFQLLAGTHQDLQAAAMSGRFRDDLLARINMWTFRLPGLRDRKEDIEPNLEFELESYSKDSGEFISFNREAREAWLDFATSSAAHWTQNFRDLSASVHRLCTLAPGGRIDLDTVAREVERLRSQWEPRPARKSCLVERFLPGQAQDEFDRVQLEAVLEICRSSRSLSDAGRQLFAVSRALRASTNDADRLRKYLARFGLTFEAIRSP